MAVSGMDTDLATSHATQLSTQGVDAVSTLISTLDSLVNQITENWRGTDAVQFQHEWTGSYRTQLNSVHQALSEFHGQFTRNIQEQISTSSH